MGVARYGLWVPGNALSGGYRYSPIEQLDPDLQLDKFILPSVFSVTLFNYKMDTSMTSGDGRTLRTANGLCFT